MSAAKTNKNKDLVRLQGHACLLTQLQNFSFLNKGTSNANVPNLMNTMMELRKCCIHPYLLNGAEEQIQDDYKTRKQDFGDEEDLYFKALTNSSAMGGLGKQSY